MRICRFKSENSEKYGIIQENSVTACDQDLRPFGHTFDLADVEILAPVFPSKIVCVGRNYAEHAKELGNETPTFPLLFLKAPSAIIRNGEAIVIPRQSTQVEHEAELAVVIRRKCKNLTENDLVADYILGYTCLNDVTARDVQKQDIQFTRGKSFDTFCPIGPHIETDLDVADIQLTAKVNGEIKQNGRTSQMTFPVEFLVRYISQQMTLLPGDVIATGTPSGVSRMVGGDICEVEVEGIGKLVNPIEFAPNV